MQQLCVPAVYKRRYAARRYGRKDNPRKEGRGTQTEKMKQAVVFTDLVENVFRTSKR